MTRSRKPLPWKGWVKQAPTARERTVMLNQCGKKCFLGPNKSFPICLKNTCKQSRKGVYAAYVRAREYSSKKGTRKYKRIASRAAVILNNKLNYTF